jgi:hypothetical protein
VGVTLLSRDDAGRSLGHGVRVLRWDTIRLERGERLVITAGATIVLGAGVKGGRWAGDSWRSASGFETNDGDDPARLALSIIAASILGDQGNSR